MIKIFAFFLICMVSAGCSYVEMKEDAEVALKNISKISEVVKENIGSKDEAKKRKDNIDTILLNVKRTTTKLNDSAEGIAEASSEIKGAASSIKASIQRLNDPEVGFPLVIGRLDNVARTVQESLLGIFGTKDNPGKIEKITSDIEDTSYKIREVSENIDMLTEPEGNMSKNIDTIGYTLSKSVQKIDTLIDGIYETVDTVSLLSLDLGTTSLELRKSFSDSGNMGTAIASIRTTSDTFRKASTLLVGMAILQLLCFAYAGLMLYRSNRQRARFEVIENIRAVTENIYLDDNGNEQWKIPARNVVYKAIIKSMLDRARPYLVDLTTGNGLMREFAIGVLDDKQGVKK